VRILGLDTATWRASVGILIDGTVRVEKSQLANGNHAVSLLPLIDDALRAAQCPLDSIDAIAVSGGPGSFTGLRVAFSVAKGLACATGAQVVTVPTLEALAHTITDHHGVVCALLDARKGEVYAACFEHSTGGWRRLSPDALMTPEALIGTLPLPCVVVGDADASYGEWLRQRLGTGVTVLPFATHGPRGGVIAALGAERLSLRGGTDIPSLEPCYIRPSEAEMKYA